MQNEPTQNEPTTRRAALIADVRAIHESQRMKDEDNPADKLCWEGVSDDTVARLLFAEMMVKACTDLLSKTPGMDYRTAERFLQETEDIIALNEEDFRRAQCRIILRISEQELRAAGYNR
jgi:hypothetical protein